MICGRGGRAFGVLVVGLALCGEAEARRTKNFNQADYNITFGLSAGQPAKTTLIDNAGHGSKYYTEISFGLGWDLGPFGLRIHGRVPRNPLGEGSGTLNGLSYSDTSDVKGLAYGGSIVLFPFKLKSDVARLFFKATVEQVRLSVRNERTLSSGIVYSERASASTTALGLTFGGEFFLLQNYVMGLETGYRQESAGTWNYRSDGTDLTGASKTGGSALVNSRGENRSWNNSGFLVQALMGLQF